MLRYIFHLTIALFVAFAAAAQTDTTRVTVTEEPAEDSDFSLRESYDYITRAQVEEKALLKIGLHNISALFGSNPILSIAYERKLTPSFSIMAEIKERLPVSSGWNTYHSINWSARYYYNMNKRIMNGKSANNFSANYIGIYQQNAIRRYMEPVYYYEPSYQLVFGMQRRISKYGYVDFNAGPGFRHEKDDKVFIIRPAIEIGLAF